MQFTIQVNNRNIRAEKGETILSALNRNGIFIPTLCRMKDFTPTGACRMCVVEVEGRDKLITACSQPVEEWMKIKTHSPRVITARKTIVELLLSNHPDDCLYCDRNLKCELQKLSEELNIRERRIRGKKIKPRLDKSSPAIVRELSKCILCGRCVRVCEEVMITNALDFINKGRNTHVGTAMDKDFNFSSCINCGQCVLVCPTGALHEKHVINEVQEYLNKAGVVKVIQYSPLTALGMADELGIKYNREFDRRLNAVLRKIGFDRVYTTGAGTDVCITELAGQLAQHLEGERNTPLFISSCPSWIKYVEQFMPELIPLLSGVKSPQQVTGALIKTIVAHEHRVKPENVFSVSATPCTAMKFEARRDGMMRNGISDVDSVLTVNELGRLVRLYGIDITNIVPEAFDDPLSGRSSSAVLTEVSGGLTEAVVRSWHYIKYSKNIERQAFRKLRLSGSFREAEIKAGELIIRVAVVDGLTGLEKLKSMMQSGINYSLVEVMACQGGCVHGAGMSYRISRDDVRNRARQIYHSDETEAVNLPCKSPSLINIYDNLLPGNKPIAERKIFYTHFEKRNVLH